MVGDDMKLVEKKCPNCGAGLSFTENDSSVKCEYCNKTYYIEKDEKKSARLDDSHLGDAYKFLNEVGKPIATGFAFTQIMAVLVFCVFLLIIGVIIFSIVRFNVQSDDVIDSSTTSTNEPVIELPENDSSVRYVTSLEQVDAISLEVFHDKSVSMLSGYHMNNKSYTIVGNWEYCGNYLLVSKNNTGNSFYDIYKHTYKNNKTGNKTILYAAVLYSNLTLLEDDTVTSSKNTEVYAPSISLDGDSLNFAWGYESIEKLYNTLLRDKKSQYSIEASHDLYVEKAN